MGAAERRARMPRHPVAGSSPAWTLVACYRAQWLAIVLLRGADVLEVRTHQLASLKQSSARLVALLARYQADYAPDLLVYDGRDPFRAIGRELAVPASPMPLGRAKRVLLPRTREVTHQRLFQALLVDYPCLRRLVTVLPGSGRIALTERWHTVQLVAVALGLAAAATAASNRRSTRNSLTNSTTL